MKKFWNWLKCVFRGFLTPAWPKRKIEKVMPTHGAHVMGREPSIIGVDLGFLPAWPVCVRCGLDVVSVDHECPTLPWSGDLAGDVNKIIGAKMQIQSICQHFHVKRTPRLSWCEDCGLINPGTSKL